MLSILTDKQNITYGQCEQRETILKKKKTPKRNARNKNKNTAIEMKNAFDRFISTLDLTEETEFLLNTSELKVADSFKQLKCTEEKKSHQLIILYPTKLIFKREKSREEIHFMAQQQRIHL